MVGCADFALCTGCGRFATLLVTLMFPCQWEIRGEASRTAREHRERRPIRGILLTTTPFMRTIVFLKQLNPDTPFVTGSLDDTTAAQFVKAAASPCVGAGSPPGYRDHAHVWLHRASDGRAQRRAHWERTSGEAVRVCRAHAQAAGEDGPMNRAGRGRSRRSIDGRSTAEETASAGSARSWA